MWAFKEEKQLLVGMLIVTINLENSLPVLCMRCSMCACSYVHVCACKFVCMCLWRSRVKAFCLLCLLCLVLVFESLSFNLETTNSVRLTAQQVEDSPTHAPCLLLSCAGIIGMCLFAQHFYFQHGDPNSSPHACKANTSPTESCPQALPNSSY